MLILVIIWLEVVGHARKGQNKFFPVSQPSNICIFRKNENKIWPLNVTLTCWCPSQSHLFKSKQQAMITLKITWRYCLALYFMTMLYISLHELVHHFAGYLICGDWGYKTFNYFATACEGTAKSWYATYAGPLFTFAMMWVGAYFLLYANSNYKKHFGFAMIFAQWPLQRMTSPFFRMNDEFVATINLFGDTPFNYWAVIIVIWLICLPPLVVAYRAIANKRRLLWFLWYLCLFPYLLVGPVFGGLEYLLVQKQVLAGTFIGIAHLFIVNEIITIIGYALTKRYIEPEASPGLADEPKQSLS